MFQLPKALSLAAALALSAAAPAFADDSAAIEAARALLPQQYRDAGLLRVSASTVYAPHSFLVEGTTDFTGYEIDLFNEVAEILDIEVEYSEAPFAQLIAAVKSGRADLSLGDLGDNDLRREQVDFIDHTQLTFNLLVEAANADRYASIWDICGSELGIVQGTTNIISRTLNQCEERGLEPVTYVTFPDILSKDQAIQSGRLPLIDVSATAVGRYRASVGLTEGLTLVPAPELGNLLIGFIVDQGNSGLAEAVNASLQILFDNGRYAEILEQWGISDLAIDAPGINIGEQATNWVQPRP